MDNESTYGMSSEDSLLITDNSVTSDVVAKLRRLKIQESIISASLEKFNSKQDDHTTGDSNQKPDWKTYSAKVKNNIIEIKNAFEDIKIATEDSEDNLKNINIEEIKKDILNLNNKIKSLEDFINTELKLLKSEEKELIRQMNEEPKRAITIKGKVKIQSKQYNEVVPSPIRVLINSPLKCNEVQQFQAFMSKSKNRYGGWNEYNHNIFIQIWNKFYATDDIDILESNKNEIISRNKLLSQFKDEVYEKIPGIKLDDIISHSKWYSEFCYLKRAQQVALDKWRDNKRKIKGRQVKVKTKSNIQNSNNEKLCRKHNETFLQKPILKGFQRDDEFELNQSSIESNAESENSFQIQDEIFGIGREVPNTTAKNHERTIPRPKSSTFASPTEQWINRCGDSNSRGAFRNAQSDIENVNKLCIPNWRLNLHKY